MQISRSAAASSRQETRLRFTLSHWCLWQSEAVPPGNVWPAGEALASNEGLADVGFLPLTQRRRLSPLAMAACAVAWNCRRIGGDMPTVFFSRHGESQYYFEMLEGMARGEGVSPSRFSLCVHNAIAGLFSFQSASFQPYRCLAGGNEGLFGAFLEGAITLLEVPKVMLVCYEQPLPKAYQAYFATTPITRALGMVLSRAGEAGPQLNLARTSAGEPVHFDDDAEQLTRAILEDRRTGTCRLERSVWHWSLDGV